MSSEEGSMDEGAGDGLTAVIRQAIQHWSELPDSEALSVECLRTVGLSGEVRGLDAIIPFVSLPLDPVAHLPWHEKAMKDGMKPLILAKITADCANKYEDVSQRFKTATVSAGLDAEWASVIEWNRLLFAGLQHYYAADEHLQKNGYGKQVSRLTYATNKCAEAVNACLEASDMCILFEMCPGSLYDLLHKSAEPLPPTEHMVNMMHEVDSC